MKEILLLSPEDFERNKPTKILNKKLKKIKSFDAGMNFYFETIPYKNFHNALEKIFTIKSSFIVLGELTDYGIILEESRKSGPRRKKRGDPTIQDKIGTEIVLDLDDHKLKGFDALNPEPAIKNWLKEKGINCEVTWQITSGQQLNTEEARIRLYFEAHKPLTLLARKAWSQSPDIQADGSVYTCSQPIYTASPIIEGIDPIEVRNGRIKGRLNNFKVPEYSEADNKNYSSYSRGGIAYDFEEHSIPEEVLSGSVYRRYFMPLSFYYANKLKGDREAIFAIIAAKSSMVKSREFDPENVYSFIDDAISKIYSEDEGIKTTVASAEEIASKYQDNPAPEFPDGIIENWPEPWPMIWDNFQRVPRQVEQPLLVPTVLAMNAYFLRANFVTSYNRRPNMFFLNLTPSTGNKDVNSKNVIRDLDILFKKKGKMINIFSGILNTESSITADTTFLQSFSESEELFWINTEATRIFQQIKMAGSISAVAALSDKLIEVVDGHEITGKTKASGKVKTIVNPNAQILFYAQPETIERYIDESMVDSGLFGRALLSIVPDLGFDIDSYDMFKTDGGSNAEIDDEFIDFYCSQEFDLSELSLEKTVLAPDKKARKILNDWARKYVAPKMATDDALQKVLSRIGNSAEQLYTIILGICQRYDLHNGSEVRESIPVTVMIPLLEYWVDTKIYAIKNFVNTELDPLAEAVLEIIGRAVTGKYKMPGIFDAKCIKIHNMVSKAQVMRILRNNTKIIRKLDADGDKRNAIARAEQIVRIFVSSGVLVERLIKIGNSSKSCIGISI